jgi:hypothetical protein
VVISWPLGYDSGYEKCNRRGKSEAAKIVPVEDAGGLQKPTHLGHGFQPTIF